MVNLSLNPQYLFAVSAYIFRVDLIEKADPLRRILFL